MKTKNTNWLVDARVVWAILAKDLLEVLKNKSTLSVLFSALLLVVLYRVLPVLARGQEPPRLPVYDAGASALVAFLENSQVFETRTGYESEAAMKARLADADLPQLGLVIPAGFDQALESGGQPTLQGYVMHWVTSEETAELKRTTEDEIARLLGRPVLINIEGNVVYSRPDSSGLGMSAAAAAAFLLTMIGVSLLPHLMVAEKQSRTLEVLLTSPAGEGHVVVAKALTGLFYCLIGGSVALVLNQNLVMHWWLAVLGMVCLSLFVVSLGLGLGVKIETRAQLSLLAWALFIPLFVPVILVMPKGLFPEAVVRVASFAPTAVFLNVWRYAFAEPISLGAPLLGLAWLLAWAVAGLGGVIWLMRRQVQGAEGGIRLQREASTALAQGARRLFQPVAEALGRAGGQGAPRGPRSTESPAGRNVLAGRAASSRPGLRILGAIVAKDMREAVQNKLILSILLGTAILVLNGAALPLLLEARSKPSAIVYDEGRSTIVRALRGRDDFRLALTDSREEFEATITAGPGTWLGLIIPADFDQRAGEDGLLELEGYAAHWADAEKIRQWTALFEQQLGLAIWGSVRIDLAGHELYPAADARGQISINLTTLIMAVSAIGIALVPILLIEEKESHTLEVLLLSPARFIEVLAAKALVGVVYCLIAASVVVLFNMRWIVHWDIVLLATILCAGFAVAVGLLVGMLTDNPTAAAFWGAPLLLLVLLPAMIGFLVSSSWPVFVRDLIAWLPGSLMLNLYRLSMTGEVPSARLWAKAAALAALAGAIYVLVGWRIQRLGR